MIDWGLRYCGPSSLSSWKPRRRRAVDRLRGALGRSQRDLPLRGGASTWWYRGLGTGRVLIGLALSLPGWLSPCVTPAAGMLVGKASSSVVCYARLLASFLIYLLA